MRNGGVVEQGACFLDAFSETILLVKPGSFVETIGELLISGSHDSR